MALLRRYQLAPLRLPLANIFRHGRRLRFFFRFSSRFSFRMLMLLTFLRHERAAFSLLSLRCRHVSLRLFDATIHMLLLLMLR